jgi:cell division protein FtsI (penicillin-binding protein 3)
VSSKDSRRRAIALLLAFGLLFFAVVVRLADVQVLRPGRFVSYGETQRLEPITLPASRGAIFDRNGNDLAISVPRQSVYADPRLVTEPDAAARRLARVVRVDADELAAKLDSNRQFVYLARRVDDDVAKRVARLDIEGVELLEEPDRFNPGGELAASLLGRVDIDNQGLSGLELHYDEALSGTDGELIREVDPEGNTIPAGRQHVDPAERGDDLVLTLDRGLQHETERVLAEQIQATGAKAGTVIVSQPETGEILALANLEADPKSGQVASTGNNLAVTATYEPGSVNKIVTMAAALEENLVTPDTVLEVADSLQVANHTYTDAPHPVEDYTVTRILAESSNVGTIQIAQRVGEARLHDYLRRFGFGEKTALDLPHEQGGMLLDPEDWFGTSIGSIPIGQGISVTAMQMLYAYNTIANDGVYRPPFVVRAVVDADGNREPVPPADGRRVVSSKTASQVRLMLAEAVADGTATAAAIDGFDVAGKTGTARQPQPSGGYVAPDGSIRHVATFAGFLPADDPKVSVIVALDDPATSPYAGDVAAPPFAEIARNAVRLLRIPPSPSNEAPLGLDPPPVRAQAAGA